jgi:putative hydrolase of the HAD superfamily
MLRRPLRALSLDLDETLLDGSRFEESILGTCETIAARQPGLVVSRLMEANSEAWRTYWPEAEHGWTLGSLAGAAVTLEVWRRTLRACGCHDEPLVRFASTTHLQLGQETYRLFDDVRDLFTSIERARVPMALVTNGAADSQRDKLRALDLEHWFDAVLISGEVGVAKPDTSIFQMALDALDVPGDRVWHVGDNLATDIIGAKAAGLTAVWLNRSGKPRREGDAEPDVEIRSLLDILPAVEPGR